MAKQRSEAQAAVQLPILTGLGPESFEHESGSRLIVRLVRRRDGSSVRSGLGPVSRDPEGEDLAAAFDRRWLRSREPPLVDLSGEPVRIVDLFSGCGGLSLGIGEAALALGRPVRHTMAVDINLDALATFAENFPEATTVPRSIDELFDGEVGARLSVAEKATAKTAGKVDILVAGPPCQGHSDLNNHTRRDDPRNSLYFRMVRAVEVLQPEHLIIENVPGVVHDTNHVVQRTREALVKLEYQVDARVLHAATIGVPQRRRRHVLVASRSVVPDTAGLEEGFFRKERSFAWACGDLLFNEDESKTFDSAAVHSKRNQERIRFLFENGLHDLPDEQRPDCHRLKDHSYKSVYGRLWWDRPVPTITSGFGSTGQGRYVHPRRPRSLTPHEAARLQFFPDRFVFSSDGRRALQVMIGNAVPSKLGYVVALDLLR